MKDLYLDNADLFRKHVRLEAEDPAQPKAEVTALLLSELARVEELCVPGKAESDTGGRPRSRLNDACTFEEGSY